jgi:hypothetical protein
VLKAVEGGWKQLALIDVEKLLIFFAGDINF